MPIRKVKSGWTFGGGVYKTLEEAKKGDIKFKVSNFYF